MEVHHEAPADAAHLPQGELALSPSERDEQGQRPAPWLEVKNSSRPETVGDKFQGIPSPVDHMHLLSDVARGYPTLPASESQVPLGKV